LFVMGVDENGLGPALGPLVVTGVGFSMAKYATERHGAIGRELGIDDSKATAAFGKVAVAEALALAAYEALWGEVPDSVDAFFARILRRSPDTLQRRCPASTHPQCWSAPLSLPVFGAALDTGRAMLEGLRASGVALRFARSEVVCPGELNARLDAGQSRVDADLEAMELLIRDARGEAQKDVRAVCGMVGGIRNYPERFRHFERAAVRVEKPLRHGLRYAVADVGQVSFEIDADQRHLPVAFASMIGKYVRELWMARQNRFYQAHVPEMVDVSGYHDPVTRRFIAASAEMRRALDIREDCFVRRSAKDPRPSTQLPLL
jgi:ribonuclease HII